jgi:hypothetical protein
LAAFFVTEGFTSILITFLFGATFLAEDFFPGTGFFEGVLDLEGLALIMVVVTLTSFCLPSSPLESLRLFFTVGKAGA